MPIWRRLCASDGTSTVWLLDLKLRKAVASILSLSWNVVHVIDEDSPLYGVTSEMLTAEGGALTVNVSGVDGAVASNIYVNQVYSCDEIIVDASLVEVITQGEQGFSQVLYEWFHDHEKQSLN